MSESNNKIKIFTDGSCSTALVDHGCNGGFCCVVDIPGERPKVVRGAQSDTTISKMEIKAVAAGLVYVLELATKGFLPKGIDTVEIYCDSQFVANCFVGANKIAANKPQWAELLEAAKLLEKIVPNIEMIKVSRNTEPESRLADKVAGEVRELLRNYAPKTKSSW